MCSGACMSHDLDTATTLTLSIIHSLKIARVLNNASNEKKTLFNLEEIMCVSICSLMWVQSTTCGPLMYDNSHMVQPQEEAPYESQLRGWDAENIRHGIPALLNTPVKPPPPEHTRQPCSDVCRGWGRVWRGFRPCEWWCLTAVLAKNLNYS